MHGRQAAKWKPAQFWIEVAYCVYSVYLYVYVCLLSQGRMAMLTGFEFEL